MDVKAANKKQPIITAHAYKRLKERVKSYEPYKDWEALVKKARYSGTTLETMSDDEYDWCQTFCRAKSNNTKIRIYNGFAYVFRGDHGRRLHTLIPVDYSEKSREAKRKYYFTNKKRRLKI